ncbi:MAG: NADH-quinone oxidoreductase subunit G [Planctomycetota bacterium]|jgi:NADH-quinone oxidoreductase subunit G
MSDSITVTINGQAIESQSGRLLIDVADENGIVIPRFCYHKKLSVVANCRMCLVEIERSPKPMPACATQLMDGMVIQTRSASAIAAQKSTMEFLLINHPLDCPICDQGGECELQDVAMGFGEGISKYTEQKRVVMDKNIGPLIATDFTRCIHCTRCVRFGDEIAGLPELGATGRGESMEIGTYIEKAISSELSGNVIDICPVGALTAKPSRYTARPWELTQHASVSAHDCIGSNTYVHTRGNDVIRVVPRENESINESWISDRDRFSYMSLKSEKRLSQPMMRQNGELIPISWETAIESAVESLSNAANANPAKIAALVSPQSTLEELYLAQKLMRGLGSNNIDHRLGQVDFSSQQQSPVMPWLGRSLESVETLDALLIVSGNLRFEQPMLSHRIRKAVINNSAQVSSIGHLADQYNFDLLAEVTGSAEQLVTDLASVVSALAAKAKIVLSDRLTDLTRDCSISRDHKAIAKSLLNGKQSAIIVGIQALANPQLSLIQEFCEAITSVSESTLGYLSPSANGAGACLAGATPHRGPAAVELAEVGETTNDIINGSHDVLLSFGVNPSLDLLAGNDLSAANGTIIAISCFDNDFVSQQADLVLPLASILETSGSFVNVEGLWQSFKGCVQSRGQSRQGWKILSALGQLLLPGEFDYSDSLSIREELKAICRDVSLSNLCGIKSQATKLPVIATSLQKIGLNPIYAGDDMQRLSAPLQATPLMKVQVAVLINEKQARKSKLLTSDQVHIKQGKGSAMLPLRLDESVPDGCVYIPVGIDAVKDLGGAFAKVELEKVS